jgi:hypothetical protein
MRWPAAIVLLLLSATTARRRQPCAGSWPGYAVPGQRAIGGGPLASALVEVHVDDRRRGLRREQKRDILYNNAARFLRLNDATAR